MNQSVVLSGFKKGIVCSLSKANIVIFITALDWSVSTLRLVSNLVRVRVMLS